MTTTSKLIGFVRKTKTGRALRLNLSKEALDNAETYETSKGEVFLSVIVNLDGVMELISEEREFITVNQLIEDEPEPATDSSTEANEKPEAQAAPANSGGSWF